METTIRGELRDGLVRTAQRICNYLGARLHRKAYGKHEARHKGTLQTGEQIGDGKTVIWSRTRGEDDIRRSLAMQDTQPNPVIQFCKPTLAQLRQQCGMSQMQVATASGVRPCRVAWIERGIESSFLDILLVLSIYSRMLGHPYRVEDVDGVKVREK